MALMTDPPWALAGAAVYCFAPPPPLRICLDQSIHAREVEVCWNKISELFALIHTDTRRLSLKKKGKQVRYAPCVSLSFADAVLTTVHTPQQENSDFFPSIHQTPQRLSSSHTDTHTHGADEPCALLLLHAHRAAASPKMYPAVSRRRLRCGAGPPATAAERGRRLLRR